MLKTVIISISYILLSIACFAQNKSGAHIGGAFLASSSPFFDCEKALEFHKETKHPYHASMWDTFYNSDSVSGQRCWKSFVEQSKRKEHTLEIYLSNEVCRRKSNCYAHELAHTLSVSQYNNALCTRRRNVISEVRSKLRSIYNFKEAVSYPTTTFLLAIGLESQYSKCAARQLVKLAKRVGFKKNELVHNPVHTGPFQKKAGAKFLELHNRHISFPSNVKVGERIISLDGIDPEWCKDENGLNAISEVFSKEQLQRWIQDNYLNVGYIGLWCSTHQGIKGDSKVSANPTERDFYISDQHVKALKEHYTQARSNSGKEKKKNNRYFTRGCSSFLGAKDGPGGFVSKESDHGTLVVILPQRFQEPFKKVVVQWGRGAKRREILRYTGFANPSNGKLRQHYRGNLPSWEYPERVVIKAVRNRKEQLCWKIEDPGIRWD